MQELIKIEKRVFDKELIETVSARDLWEFLEVKSHFTDWIKSKISDFDFMQETDFIVHEKMTQYNQIDTKEYYVTIDMAKELSMVERNEKGKQARRYFIDRDNKLKEVEKALPQSFSEALQLAADQAKKIEADRPKVEFAEKVETSVNSISVAEFANLLTKDGFKIGQNNLFKWFYENNYLIKSDRPYQKTLDNKWVEIEKITYPDYNSENEKTAHKVLITGKGQVYFTNILKKSKAVELGQVEF